MYLSKQLDKNSVKTLHTFPLLYLKQTNLFFHPSLTPIYVYKTH